MNARKRSRCVVHVLSLSLAACGSLGCSAMPRFFWASPAPAMPTKIGPAKPISNDSKPADAAEDSDDRHPSRWRQKLRAKYS